MEMIYRSMGKQYDWELQKFWQGKKYPDRGNKRRFWKNLYRQIKNPIGYYYWKCFRRRTAKERAIATCAAIGFAGMLFSAKKDTINQGNKVRYEMLRGKNPEGLGLTHIGNNNDSLALQGMPLTQFMNYEFFADQIIVNPCRNQNYRKYFQMKRKLNQSKAE
mmetsp:Transcript_25297/g.22314  ORF Transcript_25297/g.22314 Transcript_25297/m.22314 type:complete len:162 (+) Transcript_25297:180-665(+)